MVGEVVVSASTESPSISTATFNTKVESTPPENATIRLRIGANIARIRSNFASSTFDVSIYNKPESKVARRAQFCAYHWVQGSPLPPAAQAINFFPLIDN